MMELASLILPGDIFVSRNAGGAETDRLGQVNASKGWWNHVAIAGVAGEVIEAQPEKLPGPPWFIDFAGVGETKLEVFVARYPLVMVLRYEGSPRAGEIAAAVASESIGEEYAKLASVFGYRRDDGECDNCVSLVRRGWQQALGRDPRWHWPDQIVEDRRFKVLWKKGAAP